MKDDISQFFQKDNAAFYTNDDGIVKLRGVRGWYKDTLRPDKAVEQSKIPPVPLSEVFSYVNHFLELLRNKNGCSNPKVRCDTIELDETLQVILDNGIIARNLEWTPPLYDKGLCKYVDWDKKYDEITKKFNLNEASNVVWIKFTNKGHVGVIAKSFDINFNKDNSSFTLINKVNEQWDESFVFIFPLTSKILGDYTTGEIGLAIGQYLIKKGVPIIDFYSHNN